MPRSLQRGRHKSANKMKPVAVSNSSVIVAFAKICRLDILEKLFHEILVPEAVWHETSVEGKPGSEKIMRANFIYVKKVHNERLRLHCQDRGSRGVR